MCEYCTTKFNVFKEIEAEEQDGGVMEVACNAPGLIVEISKTESLTFNVNYCPMCGRNLVNEKNSRTELRDEAIMLLIENMKVQQKNMDWLTDNIDEKIKKALTDTSEIGKLNKRDVITQLLDHEKYVNSQQSVYREVEEWASNYLKKSEENNHE